jgi:iron complex transport system substrate-binding protein
MSAEIFSLKDQVGTVHNFNQSPTKIVSLVPSQTELLVDLGLEQQIKGITKFCVHPYHLKQIKTVVGGTKKVHVQKIRELNPDIIIANKEENTLEMVEELRSICKVWVTDVVTLEDNQQMIEDFGVMFNKRTEAARLVAKINFGLEHFRHFMANKPGHKVAYFIWKDPYMAAGRNTFIQTMLEINKFENIYLQKGRYPEVELKKIRLEGDPDLVLLSSEPFPFTDKDAFEIGRFTHHAKAVFVDGEMFSWYGSRIPYALQYFEGLHLRLT